MEENCIMKRAAGVIAAALLCATTAPVVLAYADEDNQPSAGEQHPAGTTDVYVQLANSGETSESNNNLAFTIPTEIDFVAKADGTLVGPDAKIVNESKFGIHVAALTVDAGEGWSIVEDADESDAVNAIDFKIGPESDMLSAHNHLTKQSVGSPSEWNMSASTEAGDADEVNLVTSGHVNNMDKQIAEKAKVATLTWTLDPRLA